MNNLRRNSFEGKPAGLVVSKRTIKDRSHFTAALVVWEQYFI
jgi:hypothetical protein